MTLKNTIEQINTVLSQANVRGVKSIPLLLKMCNLPLRPGASMMRATANVMADLKKVGVNTGKNPDGSENLVEYFVYCLLSEYHKEVMKNGIISGVVPPNTLNVTVTGENAGGPFVATGTNLVPIEIKSLLEG